MNERKPPSPELLPVDRYLWTLGIVQREDRHLLYSWQTLFEREPPLGLAWVNALEEHPDEALKLEAFVSRYGRMQDTTTCATSAKTVWAWSRKSFPLYSGWLFCKPPARTTVATMLAVIRYISARYRAGVSSVHHLSAPVLACPMCRFPVLRVLTA